jgi:hypothetical protein
MPQENNNKMEIDVCPFSHPHLGFVIWDLKDPLSL